jgi:molecular chaperone DnaJ
MASKDFYSILGLSKNASEADIKTAYKKLAKQWHPDVNKSPEATEKFKEISEAYSILSDTQKRQTYDQFGSDAFSGGGFGGGAGGFGGGAAGFDFSDLFRQGFGSGGSTFGGSGYASMDDLLRSAFGEGFSAQREDAQPLHIRTDVELTFEEAAFGVTKTIEISRLENCDTCKGTGSMSGKKETCKTCKGRGMETQTRRTPFGIFQTSGTCSNCRGTGHVISDPCKTCKGKGSSYHTKKLDVNIPAGVDNGNHLRLSKQGNAHRGKHGDVYVVLHVQSHPIFRRDGSDIYVEQPISFADAALGGDVNVPLLGGKTATLHVPPGTKPGKVFRMKDKGIKFLNEDAFGDEFVRVEIDVPSTLSAEEKTLLEELRNVRAEKKPSEGKKGKKKGFFGI